MFWNTIKENKRRKKYISKLDKKYRRFDNNERKKILKNLILIQAAEDASKKVRRPLGDDMNNKSRYADEELMDLQIKVLTGCEMKEQLEREYGIEIINEYLYLDIEYLK